MDFGFCSPKSLKILPKHQQISLFSKLFILKETVAEDLCCFMIVQLKNLIKNLGQLNSYLNWPFHEK